MKNKFQIAMTLAVILAMVLTSLALAAELVTAELAGTANDVTVEQGSSASFTIDVYATGAINCNVDSADPSKATVDTAYSISAAGALSSGTPSSALNFFSNGTPVGGSGNCGTTWTDAPTHYSVAASVSAAATTPVGAYTITLSSAASTTAETNPSDAGTAKLGDVTATTITVHVVAPPPPSDSTPPVITPSVNCDNPGTAPWCKGTITVSWSVTDAQSTITSSSGCGTSTVNSDTGASGTTFTCTATSAGGTNSQSVTVYRDGTAPTILESVSPAADPVTGWYNIGTGAPIISFACSDTGGSGLASCTPASTLGNGADQSVTGTATDGAGNSASANVSDINVDLNAPTISASITPAADVTGWYNISAGAPTVSFTCGDTGSSGLAGSCPSPVTLGNGENQSVSGGPVSDVAGNSSSVATISNIDVDLNAPTFSCAAAAASWSAADVNRACTANDTGGSGLATSAIFSLSTNVPSNTEDVNALTGTAAVTDNAGNSVTAGPLDGNKVDKKAPQLSSCDSPDGLWHDSDVILYCRYTDGGSGAGDLTVDLATAVAANTETGTAAASVTNSPDTDQACDAVGNCAASPTDIGGNMIDKKAPSISITAPAGTYLLNQVVASNFSCVDGGSDVASCSGPASVDTSSVGLHTFTVNAADNVGNLSSKSVSYSVIYKWNGFFQPIDNNMLNVSKAGSAIPVKFSLSGNQGLNIFAVGYPKSIQISCDSSLPMDDIETTVTAGGSSLSYDALADQYIYVWKTEKSWAGTCRQLQVKLSDGTLHTANFKFK